MPDTVSISLDGDRELMQLFEELPRRLANKVLVQAVSAAAAPIRDDMRNSAPKESGLLAKSIKIRSRKYKGGDMRMAVIGPSRGMKSPVIIQRTGKNLGHIRASKAKGAFERTWLDKGNAIMRDPAKYAHLVTGGRRGLHAKEKKVMWSALRNVFFPKGVRAVAGRPFIQRAMARRRAQALEILRAKLGEGITREAAALAKK
jgi:HK97 gp10 family phage protein